MDWDKVSKCKHENIYENYLGIIYCDTPYCQGYETHCRDCGVFIAKCDCNSHSGMSGWSAKRWRIHYRNHEKKLTKNKK